MRKHHFLAVLLAIFSSTVALGQEKDIDWMQEIKSRITINGYAQAGYAYSDQNGQTSSSYNLKRTLLWARARITDRWSFLFMHDFNSVVQEFYTDYRITNDKGLTVRLGQFKNSLTLENPLSPVQLELIDICSQAVTNHSGCYDPLLGLQYGRDIGLEIYGDLFNDQIHYELALMNGQGINVRDGNNDKDVIARKVAATRSGLPRGTPKSRLATTIAATASAQASSGKAVSMHRRNTRKVARFASAPNIWLEKTAKSAAEALMPRRPSPSSAVSTRWRPSTISTATPI